MITRPALGLASVLACLVGVGCGGAPAVRGEPPVDPIEGESPQALYDQGLALAQRGDLVRAEQYVVASLQRGFPEDEGVPTLLRICVAATRLRVALEYAEPYLQRHPEDWALRFLVATVHYALDDMQRAREELDRIVAERPDTADAHFLLALLLRDQDRDAHAASAEFARYLELEPRGEHAAEARDAIRLAAAEPAQADPTATGDARPVRITDTPTLADGGAP